MSGVRYVLVLGGPPWRGHSERHAAAGPRATRGVWRPITGPAGHGAGGAWCARRAAGRDGIVRSGPAACPPPLSL